MHKCLPNMKGVAALIVAAAASAVAAGELGTVKLTRNIMVRIHSTHFV